MLNVNHLTVLLLIYVAAILTGIIIRVVYNSKTKGNLFIRLKSLFVLQIIIPITLPIYLKKNRHKIIRSIEGDIQLTEERRTKLLNVMNDAESYSNLLRYSRYVCFIHFKDFLDKNIESLNSYRAQNNKELNLSVSGSLRGLLNPFIINNLIKQPIYTDKLYKEGH